jgi:hypothetical protein
MVDTSQDPPPAKEMYRPESCKKEGGGRQGDEGELSKKDEEGRVEVRRGEITGRERRTGRERGGIKRRGEKMYRWSFQANLGERSVQTTLE